MAKAPTLTAYSPTVRNRIAAALMGDNPGALRRHFVEKAVGPSVGRAQGVTVADAVIPFFGLDEMIRDTQTPGQRVGGAVGLGLAAIPVPGAVKGATKRAVAKGASAVGREAAALLGQDAAGAARQAGAEVVPQGARRATPPITAYHGSPHKFDAFDLNAIGTGEGVQAYGHGLYFAENEGVAKVYRDQTSADGFLDPNGKIWNPMSLRHMNVRATAARNGTDLNAPIEKAESLLKDVTSGTRPLLEADLADLIRLRDAGGVRPNTGHMYEVGINADPSQFLDWDAPISSHPQEVQDALLGVRFDGRPDDIAAAKNSPDFMGRHAGAMIYDIEHPSVTGGKPQAAEALRGAGVPGIKYLDQGSRGTGTGTRNYVVFDPSVVEIMRRYGIAMPVAGLGAVGAGAMSAQDQQTPY